MTTKGNARLGRSRTHAVLKLSAGYAMKVTELMVEPMKLNPIAHPGKFRLPRK